MDVRDIVTDALDTCREIVDARRHRVTTRFPADADGALLVDGDRIRLVQVVTNILNNAAKFTEPGGEIAIDAGERDGAFEICVRDNGIGISADRLPRIFDLFFRAINRPTAPRAAWASGSRWRVAWSICTAGTLTASSAGAGRGSEFRIALPRAAADSVRPVVAAKPPAAAPAVRVLTRAGD